MRYALSLPNGGVCADPRILADFAALAEEVGWDGIWIEDYIVYQSKPGMPTCDPWVALAAMTMRTERVRLGTSVTPLARRRPSKVAREAVTLDQLSNGRITLGVGLGVSDDISFANFSEESDARVRAEMLDEALDILVGLWSGEPFSYQGKHYQVGEVTFLPRPVQTPRIPIWVGGGYPLEGPTSRAACWDGSCLYRFSPDWTWRDLTPAEIRNLRTFVESRGSADTPYDIAVGGRERREDWDAEREWIRSIGEAGATWWVEWIAPAEVEVMRATIGRGPLKME